MGTYYAKMSADLLSAAFNTDIVSLQALIRTNQQPLDTWFPVNNQNRFINGGLDLKSTDAFVIMGSSENIKKELEEYEEALIMFDKQDKTQDICVYYTRLKNRDTLTMRTYLTIVASGFPGKVLPDSQLVLKQKYRQGFPHGLSIRQLITTLTEAKQRLAR